jgi:hypothetical protein
MLNGISTACNYMLDAIFIGLMCGGFMALMLYVVGCEKL